MALWSSREGTGCESDMLSGTSSSLGGEDGGVVKISGKQRRKNDLNGSHLLAPVCLYFEHWKKLPIHFFLLIFFL